jgi:hypothetical protein
MILGMEDSQINLNINFYQELSVILSAAVISHAAGA